MKTRILVSLIAGLLCHSLFAQTADDFVTQGRSYLAARNITAANTNFAQALTLDPSHETANALYAITRILVLPSQPAGSNFLTRIGFPVTGRSIYAWDSAAPKDSNGLLLAPNGLNANEFTAQLRTNVLLAVSGAVGNLAVITDTNFTISLTSGETAITDVTMDYGDLKLIQASLYGMEYLIYTLNAQNLDAQLTAIRALYTNGALSAGQVLSEYPQLFAFSTTNDLLAARAAFTNAVNCYTTASAFIRARPLGEVRLFNYDKVSASSEADFRSVLTDLENSLAGAKVLTANTNLTVNLGTQFTGSATWRSLLPKFDGGAIELGSLPDLTFGGVIGGLTRDKIEGYLSTRFVMLPVGSAPSRSTYGAAITFATLRGHPYTLEASTNLVTWQVVTSFTATNAANTWIDSQTMSKRFYRLRDDTGFFAFAGVVRDQNNSLPIVGAQIYSQYDGSSTFTDANGQFYLSTSDSGFFDQLIISATGYGTVYRYYFQAGLVSGLQIYLPPAPPNDNFANRIPLTGSNISTNGNNLAASYESGEPYDTYYFSGYGNKSVWFSWTAPTTGSYVISVSSTSVYYPILAIYTGSQLSSLLTVTDTVGGFGGSGYYAGYTINAVSGQTYQIEIDDYNSYGGSYTLSIAP